MIALTAIQNDPKKVEKKKKLNPICLFIQGA